MQALPPSVGHIHFIGIGGVGMSGIAEILHNLGYAVQGSDLSESAYTKRLVDMGIDVAIGHRAENLKDASVVVISTAVPKDNPELVAARQNKVPVVRRAEMLAQLMRLKWSIGVAGTHGKTTTTSIVGWILEAAHKDPTIINGGIINSYGSNTRLGKGEWVVVEADESDGSFNKLPVTVAIVTNIDPEHLDHFGNFEAVQAAFLSFVQNIPFYGFGVLCTDHPVVQSLLPKVNDRRIITYGFNAQADVRADIIKLDQTGATFHVYARQPNAPEHDDLGEFHLPMFGEHNVQNALSAIAVGLQLEIDADTLRSALKTFTGVKRRFTITGEVNGVTIVDDYAHHPIEITAVMKAAETRKGDGRIIAVFQPHRYTRLHDLMEDFCTCFNKADIVLVTDVYAAGEDPIEGVNKEAFIERLQNHGHRSAYPVLSAEDLPKQIHNIAEPGDLVVCLGAGSITYWANALPKQLEDLHNKTAVNAK